MTVNMLEHWQKTWKQAGFPTKVVDAPKDAYTFDKMLVIYADPQCKVIRRVSLYNSKTNKMMGDM